MLLLTEAWKEGTDQLSLILEYLKQIQCKAEPSFPHKQGGRFISLEIQMHVHMTGII